jgi:hypothetical protein
MRQAKYLRWINRAAPALFIAALGTVLTVLLLRPALVSAWQQGTPELMRPPRDAYPVPAELARSDLSRQTAADAERKSGGCVACHRNTRDPHFKETVHLGCVDCHGGDPDAATKDLAHVLPSHPEAWLSSANPARSYTLLNHERPEFIRFVNPGDLRIAHIGCAASGCHPREVLQNRMSMMTHGCMLWGAALYNNGSVPDKWARYGESYSMNGVPQRLQTVPPPTPEEMRFKGVRPYLDPLPHFEITQPGNILRIFERGGRFRTELALPELTEEPGRPRSRLSDRGLGTQNRTDPTFLGLQKTRLLDPTLNFLGTNDHPGDYRSSGCSACHVLYANDRSLVHSGPYAAYGNHGLSYSPDPTIPKDEPGHPIAHRFVPGNGIPSSQCIVCHVHPGTNVLNSYLGFMWWDEETDGELIYPKKQKYPTAEEFVQSQLSNPNESAVRNNLSDPAFLERLVELNPRAKHTQFADFHGHGWAFRAVFKQDRHGNLLDRRGKVIEHAGTAELMAAMRYQNQPPNERRPRDGVPVHLMDIHLEKGMHCVDCHFIQDVHGNTRLQGEVRAGIEIQCIDCHGTIDQRATLRTTGPAAYTSGRSGTRNLEELRTPSGKRRFEREGEKIFQNSMVEKDLRWEAVQVMDTINPRSEHYNKKAHLAKTVRFGLDGQMVWGDIPPQGAEGCAHRNSNMTCIACHTSWNASCYGCHLPQRANMKMPSLHNEGEVSRNYISYNFQTLRDEVFMLARDGDVTGNRVCPSRSSCAVEVSSFNANREAIYFQQQTVSASGLSGIAFSTNVPHTVRGRDATKQCTDCHVSRDNDNNAIMAQLLMHGTNYLNFMGRNCWVATGEHGLEAVVVTELEEPQAVIGSTLHRLAFPDFYEEHLKHRRELRHAHHHPGKDIKDQIFRPFRKEPVLAVQQRGEYVYAACGEGGVRVYDVAFIDDKGFSERIVTAPVSPFGQRFFIPTRYATSLAAPTTIAPDPTRAQRPENRELPIHAIYGYLFITDRYEGLILVGAATALDGNPLNNFLKRELTFNPDGILNGASSISIVGTYAYICCDAGLVVINLNDPKKPVVTDVVGKDLLNHPKAVAAQFRYGFAIDEDGLKVLDILDPAHPKPLVKMALPQANSIYVARTRAYIAGGSHGLIIVDVENPEKPRIEEVYTAEGKINDLRDVKLGITFSSEFAYLADGKNGLRVVQLTSPETPGNGGFSPKPKPELIATYKFARGAEALAVSKALDRDRAVDESGNQIAVFGRVGARPLTLEEQRKLYMHNGQMWRVSDDPDDPLYPKPQTPPARSK